MDYVEEGVYFHIQRNKRWGEEDFWEDGKELTVGKKLNKFMESRFFTDYNMPANLNLSEHIKNDKTNSNFIKDVDGVWREYIIKTREYIFEIERLKIDQNLPSRFKCLFLTDLEGLSYWKDKLNLDDDFTIYELKVSGRIHKANERFLELNTKSQSHYHDLAVKYWSGEAVNGIGYEFLFEGKARVLGTL